MNKYQEYWQNRSENQFLKGEKDILQFSKELQTNYQQAITEIENQIYQFYGKYQTETGLDMNTIKKQLDKNELKSFKSYINEISKLSKQENLSKQFQQQLTLLKLKSRIARIEELKVKMQYEVEKLTAAIDSKLTDKLQEVYEDGYYETIFNRDQLIGISSSFTSLNKKAIEKAVKTEYMTENYSQVLWKNKNTLLTILNQKIPQGIILGQNPKKVASIATKQLGTNYNSTVRLVRTEYNLILNDATSQGYKESGIEQYQILATLDGRTSEICQDMDLKIFNLKDKQVGVNYPPFHPNCRTTTIPYFEPDEFDKEEQRIARDNKGKTYTVPANLTYKQWKEGLKEQKDGTLIYKHK